VVTITGEYQGELHCTAVHGPSGNALSTDAPKDNKGRGAAFSPTDLVATAFATCIATTMAIVARNHGVEIDGIRYEVTKEMAPDAPRRISCLAARMWMPASARKVPAGVLEQAANNCPVHKSIDPSVRRIIEFIWE
jgi:uncharacterized OsmC-like protein